MVEGLVLGSSEFPFSGRLAPPRTLDRLGVCLVFTPSHHCEARHQQGSSQGRLLSSSNVARQPQFQSYSLEDIYGYLS
jgi:hypothetical protein